VSAPEEDLTYVIIDTSSLDLGTNESLNVTLSQTLPNSNGSDKELSTEITVAEPSATMQTTAGEWRTTNSTLNISGNTTLAPNSRFWIQVRSTTESPAGFLYHYPVTVRSNQTYQAEIDLQRIQGAENVFVRPVNRTDTIGPTQQINITG
jgi:hypothetical protein